MQVIPPRRPVAISGAGLSGIEPGVSALSIPMMLNSYEELDYVRDHISDRLEKGLAAALVVLKPAGRLVVITFHSLEDRVVKDFGCARARDYEFAGAVDVPELRQPRAPELRWVKRKAIKPSAAEVTENPRSRSAQMRVMEKI